MDLTMLAFLAVALVMTNAVDLRYRKYPEGTYDPSDAGAYVPTIHGGGRYYHDDSGRYIPDYSGLYVHDGTGNYAHDGSGDYKPEYNRGSQYRPYNRSNLRRYRPFNFPKISATLKNNNQSELSQHSEELREKKSSDNNNYFDNSNYGIYKHEVPKLIKRKIPRYDGHWKIIKQAGGVGKSGYNYLYETENKILAEEQAKVTNKGTKDESIASKGYYQYLGDDDMQYKLTYTADENGFIPQGDHLPKSIIRLLEYHRTHN